MTHMICDDVTTARRLWKVGSLLICLALVVCSVIFLLLVPPWNNRGLQQIHRSLREYAGIELHYLNDYTGPIRYWDDQGRLRCQCSFVNGHMDGVCVDYDPTGAVSRRSTYRNGEPWDGVCYIIEGKAWMAEYKAGKPWNGYMPAPNPETGKVEWKTFRDGKQQD